MKISNPSLLLSYHTYVCNEGTLLPDNVCKDLDIDSFFSAIDFTSSRIGQQYLYHILHQDQPSQIGKYESLISEISRNKEWRTKLLKILSRTSNADSYYIASLFSKSIVIPSKQRLLGLSCCRFIPFLLIGLTFITHNALFMILLIAAIAVNFALHYQNKKNIYQFYYSVPQIVRMLKQAEEMATHPLLLSVDPDIKQHLAELKALKTQLRFFKLSIRMDSDIAILVYCVVELFNIFFLTEAYAVNKALIALHDKKQLIEKIFHFVGFIDTLCSISLLREQLPYYCLPTLPMEGEKLHANAIYHPMVNNAVSNDFLLHEKSFLVTGSNMSGKTSFIRTVGINLLSAKVLNTCFAQHFSMNLNTRIYSSIHNADNLQESKSYFLQESLRIKEMIDQAAQPVCLFLLDEPFKGTNTQERIAICRAVLSALAENGNIVLVSTHDLELCKFIKDKYDLYHFSEIIRDEQLLFDYKLKMGVSTQRNAIKILELYHYPADIVGDANRYCCN